MKTCFFVGHREASGDLLPSLQVTIEQLIVDYDVTLFIVGHYGEFDKLAAKAVALAKKQHPHITLSLLLPYHPTQQPVTLPRGVDDTVYPAVLDAVPLRLAIPRANRWAVEQADYLIAYVRHTASNAANVLAYAVRRGVCIHNLGEGKPSQ